MQVAKDEKDGDIRRLLRRVTNRSKAAVRQRSRSAHGHLQSVRIERAIDDAVSAAAVEKLKLSNDELHTTSSPELDKRKGSALLSRLRDDQKKLNKEPAVSSGRRVNAQQRDVEQQQQHREHVQRIPPALRSEDASSGLERASTRNARPPATLQPTKSPPHRTTTSPLAAVPRSYCGIGSRSESVLLFPGHSRDILLKQSRDRLASTGSNVSSGFHSLSSALAGDSHNTVDSLSAAAAYLGSSADGHGPRRVVMRNRTGLMMKCWQRPESGVTAEQSNRSSVIGQENRLSLSLVQNETVDAKSDKAESSTDVSPVTSQLPFMEFQKVDHLYSVSPLSLSVQCGSDVDEVDALHEIAVVPTHRLTSKRVWNTNTHSWDDAVQQPCSDPPSSDRETPDSCNFSDVAGLSMNQNAGKMIFTRADTAAAAAAAAVSGKNTLRFANSYVNRCFFSESDLQKAAQSRLRENQNIGRQLREPAVRNVDIGASNKSSHVLRNRHSAIGGCYDETLVSSWRQQILQSFSRAKSCPEMAVFSDAVLHSVHARVRQRRQMRRFVGRMRQTLPKGSERRRKGRRGDGVIGGRRNLASPFIACWPGKGDITGSMLAYESSV